MNISKFIEDLSSQKIELWREGDRLRYRGPKEVLNSATLNQIKQYKTNILAWLSEQDSLPKVYPLSEGQKALWFIYKLAPDSCAYNIAFNARIRSQVDIPTLKKTFQYLSDRHPMLRTTFREEGGNPIQEIKPHQEICFEVAEVGQESEENLYQQVFEAYQRPFNLEEGPLMRVSLFHCSDEDYILLITIHHIVSDAWSLWGLLDELKIVYPALKSNISPSLSPLRRSYADFVNWQQKMLNDSEGERLWNYWQRKLGGDLPTLQLSTDKPRPPVQTYRGESLSFQLSQELSDKLRGLARSEGTSLFTLMLTAFQVLLHRYTGQNDILIGSPTTGRTQTDFEKVFGYFVNPVVIRANLSNNPTFKELLNQTRQNVLEAISNQDYPFPLLVKDLQPDRDPSYSPLFQVDFTWQQAQEGSEILKLLTPNQIQTQIDWGDLLLEPFTLPQQEGQFDLSLDVIDTKQQIVGVIKYNTDLFEQNTIQRMIGHFQVLLEGIVGNPEQSISQLPILTELERHQLLVEWNKTQADYPRDKCIHQLFEEQVARTPNAVAVVYEEQQLTYQDLNEKANQLAHYLVKLGVKPDDLVGICVERSLEMVIGLLGIMKSGGAYVAIDPHYPPERIKYMLSDSQTKILLSQTELITQLPEYGGKVIDLEGDWATIAEESQENLTIKVNSENLAYVIYTSGSTGKPKGAMNAHQGVVNRLLWMQEEYSLNQQDSVLQKTPFSFDVSVWEFFWTLLTGAKLVVAKPEGHKDSDYLVEVIQKERITTIHFVPSMLQVFVENNQIGKCQSLKRVICSGEAMPYDLQERFYQKLSCELHNLYGPTEAAVDVSYWACKPDHPFRKVPIGRPVSNTQLYILDQQGQPVPIGVAGELHIGGVQVGKGYFNRPQLTAEKFIPNPFSEEHDARLYKTGDLCRYLADGNIEYLGRIDYQVKIRGFRIELGEIESRLSSHPEVKETVVIAREAQPGDKRLVAYLVSNSTTEQLADRTNLTVSLRQYLGEQLPDYMIPSAFIWLEQLPLTPNGKVDRKALSLLEYSQLGNEITIEPNTPTEKMLTEIWSEILKIPKVGIKDDFFVLGGHSLLAVQVRSRIRDKFNIEVSMGSLFENTTIAELAKTIDILKRKQNENDSLSLKKVNRQARRKKLS